MQRRKLSARAGVLPPTRAATSHLAMERCPGGAAAPSDLRFAALDMARRGGVARCQFR